MQEVNVIVNGSRFFPRRLIKEPSSLTPWRHSYSLLAFSDNGARRIFASAQVTLVCETSDYKLTIERTGYMVGQPRADA